MKVYMKNTYESFSEEISSKVSSPISKGLYENHEVFSKPRIGAKMNNFILLQPNYYM